MLFNIFKLICGYVLIGTYLLHIVLFWIMIPRSLVGGNHSVNCQRRGNPQVLSCQLVRAKCFGLKLGDSFHLA